MATSSSQTPKPFSILLVTSITFFLLLLSKVNSLGSTSFSIPKFAPNQNNLLFQGDALVSSKGELELTKVENDVPIYYSTGRALYAAPVQIWDSSTGKVADFTTSFTFVVTAPDPSKTADGFAFFLAPVGSQIPKGSDGGLLGLFSSAKNDSSNQIVAVEFDTFKNVWDPNNRHIGIDVNTINSTQVTSWEWKNGEAAYVRIDYEAATKVLSVELYYYSTQKSSVVLSAVDLKSVLPEWVSIGFSANTGETIDHIETHNVLSWSFTSSFEASVSGTKESSVHLDARYDA